ncbi:MAG: hypothetical protein K2G60_04585 [Oscillospiraceae bacterium]|nr:hypothetical protein [Oscillospiraceae bacterium]
MKKFLKVISVVFAVLILGTGSYYLWRITLAPKEIMYYSSQVGYNCYDPRENIGYHPYVFVGFVEKTHDYMTERFKRKFPEIIKESDSPWTECNVKVIKNIKGNLIEGITFPLYKDGGLSGRIPMYIEMETGDLIPESGKYYIFIARALIDGTVTVGGLKDAIELESGITDDNLESSPIYQEYVDAAENEIKYYLLFNKYLAKVDKDFGDGSYNQQIYQEILKEEAERKEREKAN